MTSLYYVLCCNIKTVSNAAIHMISYKRSVADNTYNTYQFYGHNVGYTIGLRSTYSTRLRVHPSQIWENQLQDGRM